MASNDTKTTGPEEVKKPSKPRRLPGTLSDEVLLHTFHRDRRYLGGIRAAVIVLGVANTVCGDLSRKLGDLALDPADVAKRLQYEVRAAGYVPGDISCKGDTPLIDLVKTIQNARKA